jgi:uncharacterized protein YdaU (DUF1376 family)
VTPEERDNIRRLVERRTDFMVQAFFSSTLEMTGPEMGLYLLTLHYAWTNSARLPADEERLRRTLRFEKEEWGRVWKTIAAKWEKEGAWLKNRKLTSLYAQAWERTEIAVRSGGKGGKARAANANGIGPPAREPTSHPAVRAQAVSVSVGEERGVPSSPKVSISTEEHASRKRAASPAFTPPKIGEVREFWKTASLAGDPDDFFEHFTNAKWRLSGGKGAVMADWHLAASRWSRNENGHATRTVIHKNQGDLDREAEADQIRRNREARVPDVDDYGAWLEEKLRKEGKDVPKH